MRLVKVCRASALTDARRPREKLTKARDSKVARGYAFTRSFSMKNEEEAKKPAGTSLKRNVPFLNRNRF